MTRAYLALGLTLSLSLTGPIATNAQDSGNHFHFAGPMAAFLKPGTVPGSPASGLRFDIVVADKGASISPSTFDLKTSYWAGSAKLNFDGIKFEGGALKATTQLKNGTGDVIEGVRLDITGATEEYMAKDKDGKDIVKTRSQPVTFASPLLYGDVPTDQDADSAAFEVRGIAFKPETLKVTVHGTLSGLSYLGGFEVNKMRSSHQIDVDAAGNVYIPNDVGKNVLKMAADGAGPSAVAKLPDQCLGVAVDPRTGDIYTSATNNACIFKFSPSGELLNKVEAKDGLKGWTHHLRVDHKGALYSDMSGAIVQVVDGKAVAVLSEVAKERLGVRLYDIDATGSIWICNPNSLFKSDMAGKNGMKIATGPDWHLGGITVPNGCRVDANGQVYVTESEDRQEAARIAVFDKMGRPVRIFGRGDKTPIKGKVRTGQVFRPIDIAFGKDGMVYVLHTGDVGSQSPLVLMFMPF